MYTKKHFNEIAKMLKDLKQAGKIDIWENQKKYFVDVFEKSNPRFKKEYFLQACE